MERARPKGWLDASSDTAAFAQPVTAKHVGALRALWGPELGPLEPLLQCTSVPYQDNESSSARASTRAAASCCGTPMPPSTSARGICCPGHRRRTRRHQRHDLQARNTRSATRLRLVMLTSLAIAVALVLLVTIPLTLKAPPGPRPPRGAPANQGHSPHGEGRPVSARPGSALSIRRLLVHSRGCFDARSSRDSDSTICCTTSSRSGPWPRPQNSFPSYGRSAPTRISSNRSIHSVRWRCASSTSQGSVDTRYLEFDFHRVRMDGEITHVLVSVSDITAQDDFPSQLTVSQGQAQAQVDTLLGILHVEAAQLASFLSDTDASDEIDQAPDYPRASTGGRRHFTETGGLFPQADSGQGQDSYASGLSRPSKAVRTRSRTT